MTDLIDRQAALDALNRLEYTPGEWATNGLTMCKDAIKALPSATDTNVGGNLIDREAALNSPVKMVSDGLEWVPVYHIKELPPAQPEIIRCKDCKYWVPGYITDNDDFIPPKCGEWQQMVGHSSDDYCSLAERREVNHESN